MSVASRDVEQASGARLVAHGFGTCERAPERERRDEQVKLVDTDDYKTTDKYPSTPEEFEKQARMLSCYS